MPLPSTTWMRLRCQREGIKYDSRVLYVCYRQQRYTIYFVQKGTGCLQNSAMRHPLICISIFLLLFQSSIGPPASSPSPSWCRVIHGISCTIAFPILVQSHSRDLLHHRLPHPDVESFTGSPAPSPSPS